MTKHRLDWSAWLRSTLSIAMALSALSLGVVGCGDDDDNGTTGTTPTTQEVPTTSVTINIPPGATGQGAAAYGQNPLQITVGTTVTWVNQDSEPHTATSDTGVWDTGTINPGQSSQPRLFNEVGTFSYFCTIHGATSMSGTIVVVPTATPTPQPSPTASPTPAVSPTPTVSPSPSATPAGATFSAVSAVLQAKCVRCHSAFTTYNGVVQQVSPGNPAASDLYNQVNTGHGGLTQTERDLIRDWIQAGAPNN